MSTTLYHPHVGPENYRTLDPAAQQIRLLEVAPGDAQDVIQCTLKHVSLLDQPAPVYETISYCWGAPRDPSFIELDGRRVQVPASAEAAIRRMRLIDRSRVLWIDAICINQASLIERGQQVSLMPAIYRTGIQNLVYFGEDDGDMPERALNSIQLVLSYMRTKHDYTRSLEHIIWHGETGRFLYSQEGFATSLDFEALESFFNLAWFMRLWVVQECVLASASLCHWGKLKFDLTEVLCAAMFLQYMGRYIPSNLWYSLGFRCACNMAAFHDSIVGATHTAGGLVLMMQITQNFHRTEPRDIVYAILGLLTERQWLVDHRATLLEVDYAKPIPDLMRDVTRYDLIEEDSLLHLSFTGLGLDDGVALDGVSTWAFRHDRDSEEDRYSYLPFFTSACEGLEKASLLDDVSHGSNVLLGEGFVADSAEETNTTWTAFWSDREARNRWLISAKDLVLRGCTQASMMEDILLELACTIMAGVNAEGGLAKPSDLAVMGSYLKDISIPEDAAITSSTDSNPEQAILDRFKSLPDSLRYCFLRRFFVTKNGRMGLGPHSMQADDLVVILRGAAKPLILRDTGAGYQYVGEAYVYGIMDGEAVQEWKTQNKPEEIFPII